MLFVTPLSATRVESPSSRVQHVNASVLENSHSHNSSARMHDNSSARSLHGLHVARSVQNSLNSLGDRGVRERGVCVPGETKSLSTSTRLGVRCPAVEKLASPQQAPGSLHGEVWASILQKQGPKIFREVQIVPGCAVTCGVSFMS